MNTPEDGMDAHVRRIGETLAEVFARADAEGVPTASSPIVWRKNVSKISITLAVTTADVISLISMRKKSRNAFAPGIFYFYCCAN